MSLMDSNKGVYERLMFVPLAADASGFFAPSAKQDIWICPEVAFLTLLTFLCDQIS